MRVELPEGNVVASALAESKPGPQDRGRFRKSKVDTLRPVRLARTLYTHTLLLVRNTTVALTQSPNGGRNVR